MEMEILDRDGEKDCGWSGVLYGHCGAGRG
jgi:hypothetical protein